MPSWLISDGYLPGGADALPQESHEALCVLNPTDAAVRVDLTVYFADREPLDGLHIDVPARRTIHARLDALRTADGHAIPRDVPYALRLQCPTEVGVQHSRMDTRQTNMALLTAIGQRYDA